MMLVSNQHKSHRGFTLIELMVVMVILGTMLSLVAPLAVKNVDKAKVRTEIAQLNNWINKISFSSYYKGLSTIAFFDGKSVSVYVLPKKQVNVADDEQNEKTVIDRIDFDSLFFQPQQIEFNKNGFPQQEKLTYQLNDELITLNVLDIVYQRNEN